MKTYVYVQNDRQGRERDERQGGAVQRERKRERKKDQSEGERQIHAQGASEWEGKRESAHKYTLLPSV